MNNLLSNFLFVSLPLLGLNAYAGNLIHNGSFEDASETPCSQTTLYVDDIVLGGWDIVAGSVRYVGGHWQHADGNRSLGINGAGAGAISQLIPTEPGTEYTVFFDLAGDPSNDGNPVKSLQVSAAGESEIFKFDASDSSKRRMGWETDLEFRFTAVENLTELRFTSLTPSGGGPVLDNVRVDLTEQGHVTATIKSVLTSQAYCNNLTTGQTVSIELDGAVTVNCDDAGLGVSPGDIVEITLRGEVRPEEGK